MIIKCNVLVIGAGPAGLSAARILSKNGLSTVILEKSDKCGSIGNKYDITEGIRIRKIIKEIGVTPKKISFKSEWISSENNFILDSKIEDLYFKRGHDKNSLENNLLDKINNDVDIYFNSNIESIKQKQKKVTSLNIEIENEKYQIIPGYILVADGPESDFRRLINVKPNLFSKINGFGILVETIHSEMIKNTKIFLDEKRAPGGYIYSGSVGKDSFFCFVSDDKLGNRLTKKDISDYAKEKITDSYSIKNYFSGSGWSGIQEGIIGNSWFIGGAALFIDPFLGYGLNYAIESAYFAAIGIIQKDLNLYKKYTQEIQKELRNHYFAREIWRKADKSFFDRLIKAFNGQYNNIDENIIRILDLFDEN